MVTVSLYHDTRRKKDDGTYPVKLRIGVGRKAHLLKTNISLSESDFLKVITGKNQTEDIKRASKRLKKYTDKANDIIDSIEPFNYEIFDRLFNQSGDRTDLLFLLREKAEIFDSEDKIGSRNLYLQTANLLQKYVVETAKNTKSSPTLPLSVVTADWLRKFEKWSLSLKYIKKGKVDAGSEPMYSATTISMYMIRVRAIFNDCISNKEIDPSIYPFHRSDNKNGYKLPKAANSKRPLTKDDIVSIYKFDKLTEVQSLHKALFIFSYLANGMNMADILTLKWKDVNSDHFTFIRRKTATKLSSSIVISVPLNKQLIEIISRYGTDRSKSERVFGMIPDNAGEREIKRVVSIVVTSINTTLKRIASTLGITEKISTYFARHSYSNNLMNSEAPIAFISKQLGHQDIKTTQAYLDSFSTSKAAKYQENLLDDDE